MEAAGGGGNGPREVAGSGETDGGMELGDPEPGGDTEAALETVAAGGAEDADAEGGADAEDGDEDMPAPSAAGVRPVVESVLAVCAQEGDATSGKARSGQILRRRRIISGPSRL